MAKFFDTLKGMFFNGFSNTQAAMRVGWMDPNSEQAARLSKYDRNWLLYNGSSNLSSTSANTAVESSLAVTQNNSMGLKKEDGSADLPKTNWLKRNLDKINYWAFGRPYTVINEEYQELFDMSLNCWGPHLVEKLENMGQYGGVCGDAFIICMPRQDAESEVTFDEATLEFKAEVSGDIVIRMLNPSFCTPVYDPFDNFRLKEMQIQVPMRVLDESGSWTTQFSYQRITRKKVYSAILDSGGQPIADTVREDDNPIGEVYAVHIRNKPFGDSTYGDDDLREASRLNEVYNEKLLSTGEIIDYHGAPVTLVFGARAKNLTRGPNKVWGNLPKDGKVETLGLESDLPANNEYLKQVKENIHVMMGVPEIAQGVQQAISNTSGVALHTMYLPLIERVMEKWEMYGPHLISVHVLCIRWLDHLNLLKKKGARGRPVNIMSRKLTPLDYESMENDTEIKFVLPLPKDALIEAQIQETLVNANLTSKKKAMAVLGETNPEKIQEEIAEESEADLERQRKVLEVTKGAAVGAVAAEAVTDDDPDKGGRPASGEEPGNGQTKGNSEKQQGRPKGTSRPQGN